MSDTKDPAPTTLINPYLYRCDKCGEEGNYATVPGRCGQMLRYRTEYSDGRVEEAVRCSGEMMPVSSPTNPPSLEERAKEIYWRAHKVLINGERWTDDDSRAFIVQQIREALDIEKAQRKVAVDELTRQRDEAVRLGKDIVAQRDEAYERGRTEERGEILLTVAALLAEASGYAATHKDGWTGGQENALTGVETAITPTREDRCVTPNLSAARLATRRG